MAWSLYILLDQHVVITEALHGLALGSFQLVDEVILTVDDAHAFATASEDGLEHDWETDLARLRQ